MCTATTRPQPWPRCAINRGRSLEDLAADGILPPSPPVRARVIGTFFVVRGVLVEVPTFAYFSHVQDLDDCEYDLD